MDELERIKTDIPLPAYAERHGYTRDKRASSRNSIVMRSATDKIIIARGEDRHWIYFSIRNDLDSGSIVDFVQKRQGGSIGHIRQELRPWLDMSSRYARDPAYDVKPANKDRLAVIQAISRMKQAASNHEYLTSRGIPADVLTDLRFVGRIKSDHHGNAVFVHRDGQGICGYEARGDNFRGFAKGGTKGLWISGKPARGNTLVIAESGIDALSFAALHPALPARIVSTAGSLNPQQPALLAVMINSLSVNGVVIAATDADDGGRALAAVIDQLVATSGRTDLTYLFRPPAMDGADWNDMLHQKKDSASLGHRSAVERFSTAAAPRPHFD